MTLFVYASNYNPASILDLGQAGRESVANKIKARTANIT